jgi:hypothetical protein
MRHASVLLFLVLLACDNDAGLTTFNALPTATIVDPAEGTAVPEGATVTVVGVVGDGDSPAGSSPWPGGWTAPIPAPTPCRTSPGRQAAAGRWATPT